VEQTVARCDAIFNPQVPAATVQDDGTFNLDNLSEGESWNLLSTLFAAIPTASSVTDLFRSVVPQLSNALAEVKFIPTMSKRFLPPTAVLFLPSEFASELAWVQVSEQLLHISNKSFVHSRLGMNSDVASALGIQAHARLYLHLLEAAHQAWKEVELSEAQLEWLGHTLSALRKNTRPGELKKLARQLTSQF
jgi:hypothetical protein